MFHNDGEHESRQRHGAPGDSRGTGKSAGGRGPTRTLGGAALLSVFPMALVAGLSNPVVATTVLAVTVGIMVQGQYSGGAH